MTKTMMAGVASADGLAIREVAIPEPAPGQVLVKVHAAGMNRADLNAAKGTGVASADSHGKPIGMEWSGEVVAVGAGVDSIAPGTPVACSGTGGYAEYAVAAAGRCIPLHATSADLDQAAILPLALMTAYNALIDLGAMKAGDSVLIHGAGSAVGLAAIGIAKLMGARRIGATSRSVETRARLIASGADLALDPSEGWVEQWLAGTDTHGADIIVDMVTGTCLNETMKAAAILGRIVNVGRLGGLKAEIDLDLHALKRISLIGATFRTRSLAEVEAIVTGVRRDIWPHVESGAFTLPIDSSFALADAKAAHAHMASDRHFGKILIRP